MPRTKKADSWVEILSPCQCSLDGGATVTVLEVGKKYKLAAHLVELFVGKEQAEECDAPEASGDPKADAADAARVQLIAEIKEKYGVEMDVDTPYALLEQKKDELRDEAEKKEKADIIAEAKDKYGVGLSSRKGLARLRQDIEEIRAKHNDKDEE